MSFLSILKGTLAVGGITGSSIGATKAYLDLWKKDHLQYANSTSKKSQERKENDYENTQIVEEIKDLIRPIAWLIKNGELEDKKDEFIKLLKENNVLNTEDYIDHFAKEFDCLCLEMDLCNN